MLGNASDRVGNFFDLIRFKVVETNRLERGADLFPDVQQIIKHELALELACSIVSLPNPMCCFDAHSRENFPHTAKTKENQTKITDVTDQKKKQKNIQEVLELY